MAGTGCQEMTVVKQQVRRGENQRNKTYKALRIYKRGAAGAAWPLLAYLRPLVNEGA